MDGSKWENQYRTTIVCIDNYENGILSGRMYNAYIPDGDSFHSTIEFLKKMESMLDEMKFPQSFRANRVFCQLPEPKVAAPPMGSPPSGAYGTFHLKVLFRQNASWQGTVLWLGANREESFRSVLEFALLLNSALDEKGEGS